MRLLLTRVTVHCGCGARHLRWSSLGRDWTRRRQGYRRVFEAIGRDDFDEARRLGAGVAEGARR